LTLDEYKRKRNFRKTTEPKGSEARDSGIFVVQEHHASHLHYDFRLALDGVLKSWAVPKGVPVETKIKRLAVETEDHPIEYARFEGDIPEGEYGAGKVIIWDDGYFDLLERDADRIVVSLRGRRLAGRYAIVRFGGREGKGKNWLLMKL